MRTDARAQPPRAGPPARRGLVTVEFALLIGLFLTMVFFIIEIARVMYLWNTAQEITRRAARAAAVTDFSDPAALARVRQQALFRDSAGALALGGAIDDSYVRIDYLWLDGGVPTPLPALPACPSANLINCIDNPNGNTCVRMVRARLCLPGAGAACAPVPYQPLMPLLDGFGVGALGFSLPGADTVVLAESLGYRPGMANCP